MTQPFYATTATATAPAEIWDRARAIGSPVVEELPDDLRHFRVTFVWRSDDAPKPTFLRWHGFHRFNGCAGSNIWTKSMRIRRDARICYQIGPGPAHTHGWPDPLNPRRQARDSEQTVKNTWSVLELPEAPAQPWLVPRPGGVRGRVESHRIRCTHLGVERYVWIYVPEMPVPQSCDLMVLFDGPEFIVSDVPTTVDNLVAAGKIRPMIVAFIGNAGPHWPGEVRVRWQEMRCHQGITTFVAAELRPWLQANYPVSSDPQRCTVGGYSRGALAAAWVGLERPDLFGNVICHSGAFWWAPDLDYFDKERFDHYAEPNWLAREVLDRPLRNVRFYLDAGTYEGVGSGEGNILGHTRHLRDVLKAKGYTVFFQEFVGGHDFLSWRGTIADALMLLCPAN